MAGEDTKVGQDAVARATCGDEYATQGIRRKISLEGEAMREILSVGWDVCVEQMNIQFALNILVQSVRR